MNFHFDTATAPVVNVGIIAVTIIVLAVIVFKLITKFQSIKLGPADFQIAKEHTGDRKLSHMYREIKVCEVHHKEKLEDLLDLIELKLLNIFSEHRVCSVTRHYIVSTIIKPLARSVSRNNLAKLLSKQNYEDYYLHVIEKIMDKYVALRNEVKAIRCTITEYYPEWELISKKLNIVVDFLLEQEISIVVFNLEEQLKILTKYEREFSDDAYRRGIVDERKEECLEGLRGLDRRLTARA